MTISNRGNINKAPAHIKVHDVAQSMWIPDCHTHMHVPHLYALMWSWSFYVGVTELGWGGLVTHQPTRALVMPGSNVIRDAPSRRISAEHSGSPMELTLYTSSSWNRFGLFVPVKGSCDATVYKDILYNCGNSLVKCVWWSGVHVLFGHVAICIIARFKCYNEVKIINCTSTILTTFYFHSEEHLATEKRILEQHLLFMYRIADMSGIHKIYSMLFCCSLYKDPRSTCCICILRIK